MKHSRIKWTTLIFVLLAILMLGACHKKVAPPPPPPPPPAAAPTASITANPATVEKGQSVNLTWQTTNATDVSIDSIGSVDGNGSKSVTPDQSTTYRLVAHGAGGTQDATTRVTVNSTPAPAAAPVAADNSTEEDLFGRQIKDVYFDYDKADISADAQSAIQADVQFLNQHPNVRFTVEGHCDERGSTEYNLALGTNRAEAVKNALVQGGINASRIKTLSYGKEKPFCTEAAENCWQQNRRGHLVYEK